MKWSLIVVLVTVISSSQGQDFASWCPNLSNDMSVCVNQYLSQLQDIGNLFSDISKVLNVQSVLSSAYSTICQPATLNVMEDFYGCVYGKLWACIPSDWKNAFPDVEKTKGSLRFMCESIQDLDFACVTETQRLLTLANCLQQGTTRPSDLSTADAYIKYTCSLVPKYKPCADTAYGTCPKKTAEVMKKASEYSVPVGCDACKSKPSLIILITFLLLFFLNRNL